MFKVAAGRGLLLIIAALLLSQCGKKDEEKTDVREYEDVTGKGVAALVFPNDGQVDVNTLPAATYKASAMKVFLRESKHKMASRYEHFFKEAGNPKNGDGISIKADWGDVKKGDEVAQLYAEFNLPLQIVTTGTKANFEKRHRYTQSVKSNSAWRWSISGSEDPNGARFHQIFELARRKAGSTTLYAGADAQGTAKVDGNTLTIHVAGKTTDGLDIVFEVRYTK